jgi:hypothetical protein
MENWQKITLLSCAAFSFLGFLKGFKESKDKKNPYGNTKVFALIGSFVQGDTVVFGLFWFVTSLVILVLKDWILFLLTLSVFWTVRSFGETIYWFNQQFSNINRNPPEKYWSHKYFPQDSLWFIHQIFWQCITVISIIFTIYFSKIWF